MKKGLVFFTVIILNVYIIPQTTVQYGIFSGGSNNLQILIHTEAGDGYETSDQISTLAFTVIWPNIGPVVTLGTPTGTYSVAKTGSQGTDGLYNYQKFINDGGTPFNLPVNWVSNTNYEIALIPINGGSIGDEVYFELASDYFIPDVDDTDALLSINGSPRLNLSDKFYNLGVIVSLPVELSSFSASVDFNNITLKWKTATEVNNYGFEIEKALTLTSSIDGWEKIGFVKGHGNSNSPKDYNFTDRSVTTGKFIYRLKQIDTDGKYEYSDAVEVDLGFPKNYSLGQNYPNPFNPTTRIDYQLPFDSKVTIELYAMTGEKAATIKNEVQSAGYYKADINAVSLNLSSGVYLYRILAVSQSGAAKVFSQVKKLIMMK